MFHQDYYVVYSGNIVQADLLKCIFEIEGIPALLQDEFIGMIAPYVAPGGAVKVLIAESDVQQARAILDDFMKGERNETRNLRLVE